MNWTIIPADEWRKRVQSALIQNASALIEIDRKIVKAIVESSFENLSTLISEFRDKKIKVQKALAELGVVEDADDSEKELLVRVQRGFPTDIVIEQWERSTGEGASFYELSDEEVDELGQDLFYTWISHYEYIRNIFKLNTLILRTKIPEGLRGYIFEARDCFALQQYNAAVSMCRTILEGAVRDLCEKKGFLEPHGKNLININPKDVFNQLIKKVSSGKLKRRAFKIYYGDACPIIHGDRSMNTDEALRVLRETMDVVQELYSLYES
ncbi:MAG: hypothetical protein ABSH06_27135 [Thermodesulfobacteriota bacterium]